jgi:hypothetical protein
MAGISNDPITWPTPGGPTVGATCGGVVAGAPPSVVAGPSVVVVVGSSARPSTTPANSSASWPWARLACRLVPHSW